MVDHPGNIRNRSPHGSPTARDIAERAGVSQSTVSRILNGVNTEFFSERTRERVLRIAAELGYSPNPFARALRGKQTYLIGLIAREIADPFFSPLISEISLQARALGYQVVLALAHSDPDEALQVTALLRTRHTDGMIILGDLRDDQAALEEMLSEKQAILAMCRGYSPESIITVNTDNRVGWYGLMEHLEALGHRRFAFLDGGWLGDIRQRRNLFLQYLNEKHLETRPEWMPEEDDSSPGGYRAMQRILALDDRPTAVMASDDLMAMGALKAAHDAGVSVPGQLSLTGFDGTDMSGFLSPGLTTVRQPYEELTRRALELLLDLIHGKAVEQKGFILIPPEIIVRSSTGPAPQV